MGGSGNSAYGYGRGWLTTPDTYGHAIYWPDVSQMPVDLNPIGGIAPDGTSYYPFSTVSGADYKNNVQVGLVKVGGDTSGLLHPYLWRGTAASAVDLTPTNADYGYANGAKAGIQVGAIAGNRTNGAMHAALWSGTAASFVDLHVPGNRASILFDTDGTNKVGFLETVFVDDDTGYYPVRKPYIWDKSNVARQLPLPNSSSTFLGEAYSIFGDQVGGVGFGLLDGYVDFNATHAMLWNLKTNTAVDLHPATGWFSTRVNAVGPGIQVGWGTQYDGGPEIPLLWKGSAASMIDLRAAVGVSSGSNNQASGVDPITGKIYGYLSDQSAIWTPNAPTEIAWANNTSGLWLDGSKWTGGTSPTGILSSARLGSVLSAPQTVTVDDIIALSRLTFDSAIPYTVAGTNSIILTSATPTLSVLSGSHTLSAPLWLLSDTTVATSGSTTLTLAGAVTGSVKLIKTGTGTLVLSGTPSYTGDTAVTQGNVTFTTSFRNRTSVTVSPTAVPSATVAFNLPSVATGSTPNTVVAELSTLSLTGSPSSAALASVGASRVGFPANSRKANVLILSSLVVANDGALSPTYYGTLDLVDNDLIVHNGNASDLRKLVSSWFASGARNGPGLAASASTPSNFTTLAVFPNTAPTGLPFFTSYDGIPLTASDVIVKYTYLGDSNLDGVLDGKDYKKNLEGLLFGLSGWANGDTDNSGGPVTSADFSLFLSAYAYYTNTANHAPSLGSGQDDAPSTSSIPEPTAALLLLLTPLLLKRQKR
jgi:autotransporter-associated beta strand protein